ncbi:helix-turn-helix domain-containing protein [Robbsia sp. KACC 23696]|uniref:TetR/AcrR family transcriptional regulator n=1 Tax=Robbsia sp. KACC 23696 TaxID=3149231 RepID=UPI00325B5919
MDSQKSNRLPVIDSGADVASSLGFGGSDSGTAGRRPSERSGVDRSAVAPKRARGRLRVEAILAASAAVFAEQGYDAATMTEIAQRADTAIGSLYRFFPNKTALADMLVDRYAAHVVTLLSDVTRRCDVEMARGEGAMGLADALIGMMTTLMAERASVLALVDAQGAASAPLRARLRDAMLERLVLLLQQVTAAQAAPALASAKVILLLLKGVPTFADADTAERDTLLTHLRALIAHQIMRT